MSAILNIIIITIGILLIFIIGFAIYFMFKFLIDYKKTIGNETHSLWGDRIRESQRINVKNMKPKYDSWAPGEYQTDNFKPNHHDPNNNK